MTGRLPPTRHDVLAALAAHVGRQKGIRARDLAAQLGCSERELRKLISELIIDDSKAIVGTPATGYYMAASPDDVIETAKMHQRRALHELLKASRLTGRPLIELAGQLLLKT